MPDCAAELIATAKRLEDYYRDMQDMEFTIQDGKLWMLQTRNGKRTGAAMVKIAMDLLREGKIDEKTALLRMEPQKLDELLHPVFDKEALKKAKVVAKGLPASPGAATGQIVFQADDAEEWAEKKKKVVLVRIETSPEDLRGMAVAQGILTMRGGMTSHAAVVARGMGKCCVSGAGDILVDYKAKTVEMDGKVYHEGDWISLNGSTGDVYEGEVKTTEPELDGDFGAIMDLSDKFAKTLVRTNADSPRDAKQARKFGAQGIGLCRTEHMFFEGDRIKSVREMILASDVEGRRTALAKLLPMQRGDFEGIFEAMDGFGVTIRLLDPPLHEFVPHTTAAQQELADEIVETAGLNLLSAPGNDLVASTALAASGAHIVLFTTGRGTPFASPVPTVKISSNSALAGKKKNWIDFNAGVLVEDKDIEETAQELFNYVVEVASGKKVCSEEAGFHDMAIFKQGVTL